MVKIAVIIVLVAFIAAISAKPSPTDDKEKKSEEKTTHHHALEHFIFDDTKLMDHLQHHHHHKYEHAIRFFNHEMANLRQQFFAIIDNEKQTHEEFATALDKLFAGLCTSIETAYKTFKAEAAKRKAEYEAKVAALSSGAKTVHEAIKAVYENKTLMHAERKKEEIKLFTAATADEQKELEVVLPRLAHEIKDHKEHEAEVAKRKTEFEAKVAALSLGAKKVHEATKAVYENKALSHEEKVQEEKKLFSAATADQQKELAALYPHFREQMKHEAEAAKRKAQFEARVAALSPGAKKVHEAIKALKENKENEEKKLFAAATADEQKELKALYSHHVHHHQHHKESDVEKAKHKAEYEAKVAALSPGAKTVHEAIKAVKENKTLSHEDKEKEVKKLITAATTDQQKELEALHSHHAKHHEHHKESEAEKAKHKAEFEAKVAALSPGAKTVFESIKTVVENKTLSHEEKEREAKKLFTAATADQQKELEALHPHLAKHRAEHEHNAHNEQAATTAATTVPAAAMPAKAA